MKRFCPHLIFVVLFFLTINAVNAQTKSSKDNEAQTKIVDEDEGPIMFKFEPNYLSSKEKRREEMAKIRAILDTLDVSENKRRKLLRDLYKNGLTNRLSKILLVENKYEDFDE